MTCVPKPVACNWHIPTFTASATMCTLPEYNELRSRVAAGGTFFRSSDVGAQMNNIQVSCVYEIFSGGEWIPGGIGSPYSFSGRAHLVLDNGIDTQDYYATLNAFKGGSPIQIIWSDGGIADLRAQLEIGSPLVRMPIYDIVQPWKYGSPEVGVDSDHISEFSINLSGGSGGPDGTIRANLDAIRTGPAYTSVYIKYSERNTVDGSQLLLGEVQYWNGACWKFDDPANPPCAGSPLNCTGGPEADCG